MDNGGGSSEAAAQPLEWKFSQVFGERTAGEEVQEGTIFIFALSDSAYGSTFILFFIFYYKIMDMSWEICDMQFGFDS